MKVDMPWLRLAKEHQRRADACAAKHREEVAAGRYGPTTLVVLFPPGAAVVKSEESK